MFPTYKQIAAWATRMADQAERRKKKVGSDYHPATNATVKNGLHALQGHFDTCVSDLGVVLDDLFEQKLESVHNFWSNIIQKAREQFEDNVEQMCKTYNQADEMRHIEAEKKAGRRQNVIMGYLVGLAKQVAHNDSQESARYVALEEKLRLMDEANKTEQAVLFNTVISCFTSLSEQVQTVRKVVDPEDCGEGPSLKWIKANADHLIQLGKDLDALKSNDLPQSAARVNAVRSMKALGPFPMLDVRDVVDNVVDLWAKAA